MCVCPLRGTWILSLPRERPMAAVRLKRLSSILQQRPRQALLTTGGASQGEEVAKSSLNPPPLSSLLRQTSTAVLSVDFMTKNFTAIS